MGDRANVYVHDNGTEGVYLYTHWRGTELLDIVSRALARGVRWGDDQYLARIIFSEMIKNDLGGETGYGIGAYIADGADRVIDVDTRTRTVRLIGKGWGGGTAEWSFDDFAKLEKGQS